MEGFKRYQELMAAAKLVAKVRLAVHMEDGPSPAWDKLLHMCNYLLDQARHVMEGRTEDGEFREEKAQRKLLLALGSPAETVPYIDAGDLAVVVDITMWPGRGYSQDVAEDIEERMIANAEAMGVDLVGGVK